MSGDFVRDPGGSATGREFTVRTVRRGGGRCDRMEIRFRNDDRAGELVSFESRRLRAQPMTLVHQRAKKKRAGVRGPRCARARAHRGPIELRLCNVRDGEPLSERAQTEVVKSIQRCPAAAQCLDLDLARVPAHRGGTFFLREESGPAATAAARRDRVSDLSARTHAHDAAGPYSRLVPTEYYFFREKSPSQCVQTRRKVVEVKYDMLVSGKSVLQVSSRERVYWKKFGRVIDNTTALLSGRIGCSMISFQKIDLA